MIGRYIDVRGAIMTIHAVHVLLLGFCNLLLGNARIFDRVDGYLTGFLVLRLHPWNYLFLRIARNITDLVRDVHVPMNTRRGSSARLATSRLDQELQLTGRVLFIVAVVSEN